MLDKHFVGYFVTSFNICIVKVGKWINGSIPRFAMDLDMYPEWNQR